MAQTVMFNVLHSSHLFFNLRLLYSIFSRGKFRNEDQR
jgi:hypothetical protein